jgi:hypothetical protein
MSAPAKKKDKVKELAAEFEIDDLAALRAVIWRAVQACATHGEGIPDLREADTLDELKEPLGRVIALLSDPLNGNRLAQHMRSRQYPAALDAGAFVLDLTRQLEIVGRLAAEAHRERAQKTGALPNQALHNAAVILRKFWTDELGREFTRNHVWAKGKRCAEPVTPGEMFIFRAVGCFAPHLAPELRAIFRKL